jgi:hypothetical protein
MVICVKSYMIGAIKSGYITKKMAGRLANKVRSGKITDEDAKQIISHRVKKVIYGETFDFSNSIDSSYDSNEECNKIKFSNSSLSKKIVKKQIKPVFQEGQSIYITKKSGLYAKLNGIEGVIKHVGIGKDTWIRVSFENNEYKVRSGEISHIMME